MNLIEHHLLQAFGQRQLQSISRKELSDFLHAKAQGSSSILVGHLCSFLKTIFAFALADGVVMRNPAAVLTVPRRCKPGRYLRSLTAGEVEICLSALGFREQLIARLAIFSGMRPGEIFGLRWTDIEEEYVTTDHDQKRAAVQAIEAAVKAAAAQVKRVESVQGIAQWTAAS